MHSATLGAVPGCRVKGPVRGCDTEIAAPKRAAGTSPGLGVSPGQPWRLGRGTVPGLPGSRRGSAWPWPRFVLLFLRPASRLHPGEGNAARCRARRCSGCCTGHRRGKVAAAQVSAHTDGPAAPPAPTQTGDGGGDSGRL